MTDAGKACAEGMHRIRFGSESINCQVRFGRRDRLRITVHPDQRVVADAPAGKALQDVLERVRRRGGWIVRQRQFFEQFLPRPPQKRYVSGETFRYLGRQYRLKVIPRQEPAVKLVGRYLRVYTADRKDSQRVRALVERWYRNHARDLFERRMDICLEVAGRHEVLRPEIKVRRMTRRWGSSPGPGRILLNPELVKAPVQCIDYVIMHELCHQRHPNHSRGFYRLLTSCMPGWQNRKEWLERVLGAGE